MSPDRESHGEEVARAALEGRIRSLEAQIERLDFLRRGTDDGYWEWNLQTDELVCSDRWLAMLGLLPEARPTRGADWLASIHPDDRGPFHAALAAHLDGRVPYFRCEYRVQHRDGSYRWFLVRGQAQRDPEEGTALRIAGAQTDISRRVAMVEALRESEERYRQLIELTPEAILVYQDERLVYANRRAHRLLGIEPDSPLPPALQAAAQSAAAEPSSASSQRTPPVLLETPEGATIYAEVRAAPISLHGEPATILVLRDVTERIHYETRLVRASEEAHQAARAKDEFLAAVSHELRTPIHNVFIAYDLLSTTDLDEEQRETLDIIQRAADMLMRLIDDVLDFTRAESGFMTLSLGRLPLRDLVEDVIRSCHRRLGDKPVDLRLEFDPDVPDDVIGDRSRLRQVIYNLVENAVKFTEEGYVAVRVRRQPDDEKGRARVHIQVEDTGIGISEDRIDAIFEVFSQAHAQIARVYGGTGLGLAICKRIVALMDGTLTVTSRLGQGSTFTVELPFALPESPRPATKAPHPGAGRQPSDLRLLLVSSSSETPFEVAAAVEPLGAAMDAVESGAAGIERFRRRTYDAVFLDLDAPTLDGADLAARMRAIEAEEQRRRTPIIALTGRPQPSAMPEDLLDGSLALPVDRRRLAECLAAHLPRP